MRHKENIDRMLSHYFDGVSTLDEERDLREYFAGDSIDQAHYGYRDMFRALDDIAIPVDLQARLDNTIDHLDRCRRAGHIGLRRFMLRVSAVAACIAIVLSIVIPISRPSSEEDILCGMTTEEVAAHTTMALQLMSRTINAGQGSATRAIETLSRIEN